VRFLLHRWRPNAALSPANPDLHAVLNPAAPGWIADAPTLALAGVQRAAVAPESPRGAPAVAAPPDRLIRGASLRVRVLALPRRKGTGRRACQAAARQRASLHRKRWSAASSGVAAPRVGDHCARVALTHSARQVARRRSYSLPGVVAAGSSAVLPPAAHSAARPAHARRDLVPQLHAPLRKRGRRRSPAPRRLG
jgi:hypothetical protein